MRYSAANKTAIQRHRVRCFCLTRQDLRAEEMARHFLDNLFRMTSACTEPGPFVYAVHEHRIEKLTL